MLVDPRPRGSRVNTSAEHRVVIVTGGGGGIGAKTVLALADRGVRVLAVDRDETRLDEAAASAREAPGEVVVRAADVSHSSETKAAISEATDRWGRLDGYFNNAAIEGPIQLIGEYREEDFDRVFAINVKGVWLGIKHALPALRASGGGSIVNMASSAGLMGWPRLAPYVGAKHAVIGLTRALAMEGTADDVRVNAICPGPTDTPMIWSIGEVVAPGDPAKARQLQEDTIPLARLGEPQEIAALATWLLLDAPAFLTGAVIPVDGGQTAGFGMGQTSDV